MKPHLFFLLFCFIFQTSTAQNTPLHAEIFFEVQEAKITQQHETVLDNIINTLNNYADFKIIISGHADGMGEQSSNKKLSERRAKAVQYYFMENRILAEKTEIVAYGEARPALSNDSEAGRQRNRRADITVYYQLNDTEPTINIEKTPIDKLYKKIGAPKQRFCINPQRDTCLRALGGTLIYLKANSFDLENTFIIPECIDIEVKEVFKNSDIVLENLSTTSNGELLQTQGMISVIASIDDIPLTLARGKDILIFAPQKNLEVKTKPYDGHRFSSDNTINWTANNTSLTGSFSLPVLNRCALDMQAERQKQRQKIHLIGKSKYTNQELSRDYLINSALSKRCQKIGKLFYRYQIPNLKLLTDVANRPLYTLFEVNKLKDLNQKITAEQRKANEIEKKMADGEKVILPALLLKNVSLNFRNEKLDYERLKYFTYNITRMGWSTLNFISDFDQTTVRDLSVNLSPDKHIDIKLVSKEGGFVLGAQSKKSSYRFERVPANHPLWIVALKYENKIPYLAISPVNETTDTYDLDFQPVSIHEIADRLKILN